MADTVARWLDWTEANRRIYLGTIAPGEDIADLEVRRVVADLRGRAVALLASFHADIAQDSPRLRHALECWTGLNRAATRQWLRLFGCRRRSGVALLVDKGPSGHLSHVVCPGDHLWCGI